MCEKTQEMRKIPFFKMGLLESIQFIKTIIQPNVPTLGDWFGWNQPNEDDTVKFGSVYGKIEVIKTQDKNYRWQKPTVKEVIIDAQIEDKNQIKDILREYRSQEFRLRYRIDDSYLGLFCVDEVFAEFSNLEDWQRALYRLLMANVNTYNKLHDCFMYFGEWLASKHVDPQTDKIELYESSGKWYPDNLINDILESGSKFPDSTLSFVVYENELERQYSYEVDNLIKDSEVKSVYERLQDDSLYNDPLGNWESIDDIMEFLFSCYPDNYYVDQILKVLSCFCCWVIDNYNDGYLTLLPDNMPTESTCLELMKLAVKNERMIPLPGFEEVQK